MNETSKRAMLYGATTVALGAMIYGGFVHEPDPDFGTLIRAADVHAASAARTPPGIEDTDGRDLRSNLIAKAKDYLVLADGQRPATFVSYEQHAYLSYLDGDYMAAAGYYGKAADHPDCREDQVDKYFLNRIRLIRRAGNSTEALAEFETNATRFVARSVNEAKQLHCRLLGDVGQKEKATKVALSMCAPGSAGEGACVQAGNLLEEIGDIGQAQVAYSLGSHTEPTANYYLARLKVRSGAYDKALELLETSLDSATSDTLSLLDRDVADWEACSENYERFQELKESRTLPASPR